MGKRTNQFQDSSLKAEIDGKFGGISSFSRATGIKYDAIYRVVAQKPASTEEIGEVLTAFNKLDPDAVDDWYNNLTPAQKTPELNGLYAITLDLYAALKKQAESCITQR